jgi:hypothetical protein
LGFNIAPSGSGTDGVAGRTEDVVQNVSLQSTQCSRLLREADAKKTTTSGTFLVRALNVAGLVEKTGAPRIGVCRPPRVL